MIKDATTAKELAAELNVTVQTIYRRLKKLSAEEYTYIEDGVTMITAAGARLIAEQGKPDTLPAAAKPASSLLNYDEATRELLKAKDDHIAAQDKHIDELTRQLDGANNRLDNLIRQLEQEQQLRLLEGGGVNASSNGVSACDVKEVTEVKTAKPSIMQRIKNMLSRN